MLKAPPIRWDPDSMIAWIHWGKVVFAVVWLAPSETSICSEKMGGTLKNLREFWRLRAKKEEGWAQADELAEWLYEAAAPNLEIILPRSAYNRAQAQQYAAVAPQKPSSHIRRATDHYGGGKMANMNQEFLGPQFCPTGWNPRCCCRV